MVVENDDSITIGTRHEIQKLNSGNTDDCNGDDRPNRYYQLSATKKDNACICALSMITYQMGCKKIGGTRMAPNQSQQDSVANLPLWDTSEVDGYNHQNEDVYDIQAGLGGHMHT